MTRRWSSRTWSASVVAFALAATATAASAQTPPPESPPDKGQVAAAAPPEGRIVQMGPSREIKLADNTWFRFAVQIQAWAKMAQDRINVPQPDGTSSAGGYAADFYCRRCRFFATGSLVKDVTFNFLFEAGNFGKADPVTGAKSYAPPNVLDAYVQVKFADYFYLSGGNILLPISRNGTQPTTTYLSIDNANIDITGILQGNSLVLRDLGFQANGFFLDSHLEYRLGAFQGSRAGSTPTQTAGHNPPRFVGSLQYNFWDTEKGYVNGGHYYGTKKTVGAFASFDYQTLRTADPVLGSGAGAGIAKGAYYGIDAAAFINYPLSGSADKAGGDEIVALLEWSLHDGGGTVYPAGTPAPAGAVLPTYGAVLKQMNLLAEAAYFNKDLKMSFFGKYEMRIIDSGYTDSAATPSQASLNQKASANVAWLAFGLKYYLAPGNLLNLGLQYERIMWSDALPTLNAAGAPSNPGLTLAGTNNITLQLQMILY